MYKAIQNKKYYLAINTFLKTAKTVSPVYLTGIRNWESDDMKTYSIVLGTFRIMFGIKKDMYSCMPESKINKMELVLDMMVKIADHGNPIKLDIVYSGRDADDEVTFEYIKISTDNVLDETEIAQIKFILEDHLELGIVDELSKIYGERGIKLYTNLES